jgi:hypothetical protein
LKQNAATANIPVVIVAGKQSGFDRTEKRANFAIFKDIDIEDQLGNAVEALLGTKLEKGQAAKSTN